MLVLFRPSAVAAAGRLNSGVRPQMTILDTLAKAQRNFIVAVLAIWLVGLIAMITVPPRLVVLVSFGVIAVMLGAFGYLHRTTRCPRCHAGLWLSLHKLVPLGPFRPRLNHCPSCGVSVGERAAA